MKKRAISIILALCMIIPLIPTVSLAGDYSRFEVISGTSMIGTESCKNLFDGKKTADSFTKWCVQNYDSDTYVIIKADTQIGISGYTFTTGNDTATYPGRNPKAWALYGANEYEARTATAEWTLIHSVSNGEMPEANFASKSFTISPASSQKYQYYKFCITENCGAKLFQLCEISFNYSLNKTVSLGTSAIDDSDKSANKYDYIYFTNKKDTPVKWRVLSKDGNSTTAGTATYKTATGESFSGNPLFLFSEEPNKGPTIYATYDTNLTTWQGSYAQQQCQSIIPANSANGRYVLKTTKYESETSDTIEPYSTVCNWSENTLNDDTLFLLSAPEAMKYLNTDYSHANVVLRSGVLNDSIRIGYLSGTPSFFNSNAVNVYNYYIHSAFNFDTSYILFTSAAAGGKTASSEQSMENEHKLTLLDPTRTFTVSETSKTGDVGETLMISYKNAVVGDNEYVSAIIENESGEALWYDQLGKVEESIGTAFFSIPDTLPYGNYSLHIFNEQLNGDYQTDYSSAFQTISLTVAKKKPTPKAVSWSSADITDGDIENNKWDYIYFGSYNNTPIKWRVLSRNGSSTNTDTATYKTKSNSDYTGNPAFLLSEYTLDSSKFGSNTTWQGSTAQTWCSQLFSTTSKESDYILKTTKTEAAQSAYNANWKETILFNDTAFIMSAPEALKYIGRSESGPLATTNTSGTAVGWWLRSPSSDQTANLAYVTNGGRVLLDTANIATQPLRPALNIDLSYTFLISQADIDFNGTLGMKRVGNYSGSGYHLTMLDTNRNFNASFMPITGKSGDTISFEYSKAETGNNEYISALLLNADGDVVSYGPIAKAESASGSVDFTIPYVVPGNYSLCIFNEQVNDNSQFNFSSSPISRPITINMEGTGTASDPYIISNLELLEFVRDNVNDGNSFATAHFKLTDDIDMADKYGADKDSWIPIGLNSNQKRFNGHFDGNGHKISNLYIGGSSNNVGLFGSTGPSSTIKGLGVSGSVNGDTNVGGLVGRSMGNVYRCYNECSVNGVTNVGGLLGYSENFNIENCYNAGIINGTSCVGGLFGYMLSVEHLCCCFSYGKVTATSDYGGICGQKYYPDSFYTPPFYNCYYLSTSAPSNISVCISRTENEFKSGKVAYELQEAQSSCVEGVEGIVWGQTINTNPHPVLNGKKVFKRSNTIYSNNGPVDFKISDVSIYTTETKASIYFPLAGTYSVIFVKYNPQNNTIYTVDEKKVTIENRYTDVIVTSNVPLRAGDKIMIWNSISDFKPKCTAYTIPESAVVEDYVK